MEVGRNGTSLKDFIERNHSLLSALAIFATIAGLLSSLPIKWLSSALSFIFIAGMVIIWLEIQAQLPKKAGLKLFLFRYVLLWGLGGLVFYWLLEFRELWRAMLFPALALLFFYEIALTIRPIGEWPLVGRLLGIGRAKNPIQEVLRVILLVILGILALYLASLFSVPINLILDWIRGAFR